VVVTNSLIRLPTLGALLERPLPLYPHEVDDVITLGVLEGVRSDRAAHMEPLAFDRVQRSSVGNPGSHDGQDWLCPSDTQ
jgi:hypothetical protein